MGRPQQSLQFHFVLDSRETYIPKNVILRECLYGRIGLLWYAVEVVRLLVDTTILAVDRQDVTLLCHLHEELRLAISVITVQLLALLGSLQLFWVHFGCRTFLLLSDGTGAVVSTALDVHEAALHVLLVLLRVNDLARRISD